MTPDKTELRQDVFAEIKGCLRRTRVLIGRPKGNSALRVTKNALGDLEGLSIGELKPEPNKTGIIGGKVRSGHCGALHRRMALLSIRLVERVIQTSAPLPSFCRAASRLQIRRWAKRAWKLRSGMTSRRRPGGTADQSILSAVDTPSQFFTLSEDHPDP